MREIVENPFEAKEKRLQMKKEFGINHVRCRSVENEIFGGVIFKEVIFQHL